jgi:hypothetical protein
MSQLPSAKPTLIAISIAAAWILLLHAAIVIWAMREPTRIDERVDARMAIGEHGKSAAAPAQTDKAQSSNEGSASGADSHAAPPAFPMPPQLSALGWGHVAFPTILLASCVAIFALLVWAAVALNRDFD